ncbi:NADPH-dependent FMN reductase [Actinomadura chibensis]|uniref:NAD(P)H-dependent oxidoreductase n=1 Tax=Actinomadura chibensis TaxID=392828 RepID=A0A5D0NIF9_9ACTN|nr:NAD(P)H-dependent oxidoreductase [Actinomadura chibensis]TYB44124.1 NAD(P)H-dependent oxidoreductase [Actinomadura chibensis]
MATRIVSLIGNPRPESRTRAAAVQAAELVGGRIGPVEQEVLDLSALAPALGAPSASAAVEAAVQTVLDADVLVVASPTYKGAYTGLLKTFLDRLSSGALASTVALPLMVMGDARHALAVEVHLRPVLVELGAFVPTPGGVLLESQFDQADKVLDAWARRVAPQVEAAVSCISY